LLGEQQLDKVRALAAFSPDALSSIAYANQEIYLALLVAGSAGLSRALPIAIAITALLVIVALSYYQTIHAYPSGGGSYVVARANLGTLPGLIAGAALLIGYLLTAAVSLTAGVAAIASAFPNLWPHRVTLSLALLAAITLANLRGTRESGTLMAVPVYMFLLTYLPMLAHGAALLLMPDTRAPERLALPASQPLTALIVLNAFAAGCTALTGIEAISNGVPAFRPPEARNARITLAVMALLMSTLFLGSVGLTQYLGIVAGPQETILSALARRVVGQGPLYVLVQASTMLILTVAANTSFAGFPRLAALLASDGFLPRQLTSLGDRLVYANGITLLSVATALLIIVFDADTHALVPLFAVGVFLAFTLSQAGMVSHWWRQRGRGWQLKSAVNAAGALATGLTVLIVGASRFLAGAWITVLLIPALVIVFSRIRRHYHEFGQQLSLEAACPACGAGPTPRLIVPFSGVHQGTVEALRYALSVSKDVTAVYVEVEPGAATSIREQWGRSWPDVPLVVLPSPYRSIVGPLLDFLDETDREHNDGQLATVVLPELVPARWWHGLLHNHTARLVRSALLYRRRQLGFQRAIIDVPHHLSR
jgi:amino acid transporter